MTNYQPLLGVGAATATNAPLWRRQRLALADAMDAFGVRSDADCFALERAVGAYLTAMRTSEAGER